MEAVVSEIDHYTVNYGTVSDREAPNREYVRIDCFYRGTKAGQILLGNSVNPGNYASVSSGEIHLYFPLAQFANIHAILQGASSGGIALYLESDPNGKPSIGGVRSER